VNGIRSAVWGNQYPSTRYRSISPDDITVSITHIPVLSQFIHSILIYIDGSLIISTKDSLINSIS
jgi:hypothetical protein